MPSKSSKKRDYLALQAMGEQLILLREDQLVRINTSDKLIEQILLAKRIRSRGALRRQKQLIGKIMREVDIPSIQHALAAFGQSEIAEKTVFKQTEHWRDRIAGEGQKALQAFFAQTGQNSDVLRAQLSDHNRAPDEARRCHIRRQMFREIHRLLLMLS